VEGSSERRGWRSWGGKAALAVGGMLVGGVLAGTLAANAAGNNTTGQSGAIGVQNGYTAAGRAATSMSPGASGRTSTCSPATPPPR
jgi:hypothetical protein